MCDWRKERELINHDKTVVLQRNQIEYSGFVAKEALREPSTKHNLFLDIRERLMAQDQKW